MSLTNFGQIITECLTQSRISANQTTYVDLIKSSINEHYIKFLNEKKWWFLRTPRDLEVPAKYETGTANVSNDSREVTINAAGVVSDNFKERFFTTSGQETVYRIVAVNTATNKLILSAPYVGPSNATISYTIYQCEFGLWPDCEEVDDIWHDKYKKTLSPIGPREMMKKFAACSKATGYATHYTRSGKGTYSGVPLGKFLLGYDFLKGSNKNNEQLIIYPPVPQEQYIIHIIYNKIYNKMNNDSDIPATPKQYNYMWVNAGLGGLYSHIGRKEKSLTSLALYEKEAEKLRRKHDDVFDLPCLAVPDYMREAVIDDSDSNYAWDERWDKIW